MLSIRAALDLFLHLDRHLTDWAGALGPWLYAVLFLIVFCETGLVIAPYLPGDSLLFAVGALCAREDSPLKLTPIIGLLAVAAILGDAVNYAAGYWIGPRVFSSAGTGLLNRRHLDRAHAFYEKYGGKTIILARFVPVVRTFAPFVAGVGRMAYPRFALYNVAGGLLWTGSFLVAGHRFANLPAVKQHFHYVILAIVGISVLPMIGEYYRATRGPSST